MNYFPFKYRNLVLGITATAVGYYSVLLPHTIFLNEHRQMVTTYRFEKEVPLGVKINQRIQKVMDNLKLPDDIRSIIRPFSVFGFDLYYAGTLNKKYGAILGIPANFINTAEEIHRNLLIKQEPIDWTREDAQSLMSAVLLSENAQKFAIACEIFRIQAEEPYYNSYLLAFIITILWTFYNAITYTFKLRGRNVLLCRSLYLSFAGLGAISWFGIKDYRSYNLDLKTDEALCNLGAEYIKGGQEFYEKMLTRNKAIRSLIGKEGEKMYTAYGNEYTVFRQKHVPISNRKIFFDSRLQNLDSMT